MYIREGTHIKGRKLQCAMSHDMSAQKCIYYKTKHYVIQMNFLLMQSNKLIGRNTSELCHVRFCKKSMEHKQARLGGCS